MLADKAEANIDEVPTVDISFGAWEDAEIVLPNNPELVEPLDAEKMKDAEIVLPVGAPTEKSEKEMTDAGKEMVDAVEKDGDDSPAEE